MPGREKAYVALVDLDAGTLHIPVKAATNRVTHQPTTFCGNCPQLLGGNVEPGSTWYATLLAEVTEETVGTYALNLAGGLPVPFYQYTDPHNGNHLTFYWQRRLFGTGLIGWDGNPQDPLPAPPPGATFSWGEMQAMVAVEYHMIPVGVPPGMLAEALILLTGATPTPTQRNQLVGSATLAAFGALAALLNADAAGTPDGAPGPTA